MRPSQISWIFFFFQTGKRVIALLPKLIDPVNLALEPLAAQKHKASAETSMETHNGIKRVNICVLQYDSYKHH